ncbi:MAG: tRNA lysidine(34) synthetase TilS [Pseudomonadales bacterium]|nr:tRNA lysidine(34) synthetase TilS [Pseudomonadales bacterium]NRA15047.1 tRNA lysidine(34) synthetase TilS [Oceanospirillaceae bacterium]
MTITQQFAERCGSPQISNLKVQRWVIALSGGLDSIVVLDLAHRTLAEAGAPVVAIHVNHQLQSAAHDWQNFCRQQCQQRDIPLHSFSISPGGGSEQQLRDARYQCFENFLQPGDCLLLGHHANDQAETLLFRLIRGAGAKGLSAMPQLRRIAAGYLFRPLLQSPRNALQQYADQQQLAWVDDPSNDCLDYDRNYIRHRVLAPISQHWHKAAQQMAVSAQLLDSEQKLLASYLAVDVAAITRANTLDLQRWHCFDQPKGIALLRHWLVDATARSVSRKELQRIVKDVINSAADGNGFCQLGSYKLRRYQQRLYLLDDSIQIQPWPELRCGQMSYITSHGSLNWQRAECGVEFVSGMYLTSKSRGLQVTAVNRPRKKFSKIMQQQQIPPWLRDNWPLLMYADQLVAIPGICICQGWLKQGQNKSYFSLDWQPL